MLPRTRSWSWMTMRFNRANAQPVPGGRLLEHVDMAHSAHEALEMVRLHSYQLAGVDDLKYSAWTAQFIHERARLQCNPMLAITTALCRT